MKINVRQTNYHNESVDWISITNSLGLEVSLTSFGASLYRVFYKEEITYAPCNEIEFIECPYFYGKTVGRISGRIENSVMDINGTTYGVHANEGRHCLHSGKDGLSNKNFKTEIIEEEKLVKVVFTYYSKDGEAGFPGNMTIKVTYLIKDDELLFTITHDVVSDIDTPVNLTNHAYFCLGEFVDLSYMDLKIAASRYLTVDHELIVKENLPVTPFFDFRKGGLIANHLAPFTNGISCIDHDFVLDQDRYTPALVMVNPKNKLKLIVDTNYPILHIYANPHRPDFATYNALAIECKKSNIESMMIKAFEHEIFTISYRIEEL